MNNTTEGQDTAKYYEGKHILVVEDDRPLLDGVRELLKMRGFEVTTALNGAKALDKLHAMPAPPDIIVSDIAMPVMDGYQFLKQVRAHPQWLHIPVIFLTAKGSEDDRHDGFLRGVNDYVPKPFEFEHLVSRIKARLIVSGKMTDQEETRMEALRRRVLTVINHELRTPLSYIVAYTDLLATSEFAQSQELIQYINGIMNGTERLSRLVESFLILAELESGDGLTVFNRRVETIDDFERVARSAMQNVERPMNLYNVEVRLSTNGDLPEIRGDSVYLEIALRHLLDNAVKFTDKIDQPYVDLTLRHEAGAEGAGTLVIEVRDYGKGFEPDEVELLFKPYYQDKRDEMEQQGIGAGLAIVRHVTRLHGGEVEAHSHGDEGATFSMRLPAL